MDDISLDAFINDADLREIVSFNLIRNGELANGLSSDFCERFDGVPWNKIVGQRNIIVHAYDGVDYCKLYQTSKGDVCVLKAYCEAILK